MLAPGPEAPDGEPQPEGRARRLGRLHDRQDDQKVLGPLHNCQSQGHAQAFGQVNLTAFSFSLQVFWHCF